MREIHLGQSKARFIALDGSIIRETKVRHVPAGERDWQCFGGSVPPHAQLIAGRLFAHSGTILPAGMVVYRERPLGELQMPIRGRFTLAGRHVPEYETWPEEAPNG